MYKINYQTKSFSIFCIFIFLYAGIITRLYYVQVMQKDFFNDLAMHQHHITIMQRSPRASIFDRTGNHYLAMNKDCVSAFILPSKLDNAPKVYTFLAHHFPHAHTALQKRKHKHFMYIKRRLNQTEQKLITHANIPDIKLLHETSRFYPEDSVGPIIGLTDIDNHGLFGIELQYNHLLGGTPAIYLLEKDARSGNFYFKKKLQSPGTSSQPLYVSIDSALQFLAKEELQQTMNMFTAKEGAVLIMNPDNGEILSMLCMPCFDPHNTEHLSLEETKNKIITECYELGSVMKVFTALAALEEKVVTPDEIIDCKGTKTAYIDGRKINTVSPAGPIPFRDVIRRSNNIGIAQVAKRLDTKLYEHLQRVGFGKKTGILFPGEAKGFINPPELWSKQSVISLSYGYEIMSSLLQLACAFCIIANNGYPVVPTLLYSPDIPVNYATSEPLYSQESIDTLNDILSYTALPSMRAHAQQHQYRIRSKTGTANMLIDGIYDPTQNLFTCAGIVQKGSYKRVIVTFIKQIKDTNLLSARVAAPLFERIVHKLLIHDHII